MLKAFVFFIAASSSGPMELQSWADGSESLPGRGIISWVPSRYPVPLVPLMEDGSGHRPTDTRVLVGNRLLMSEHGVSVPRCHALFHLLHFLSFSW